MISARLDHEASLSGPPPPKVKQKDPADAADQDAFAAYREDDIGYERPLIQRALVPLALFLVVGCGLFLGWPQIQPHLSGLSSNTSETVPAEEPIVVKRASGESGLSKPEQGAQSVTSGPLSIGQKAPAKVPRRRQADPGIDWDNSEVMDLGGGKSYNTDHSQKRNYGRDADAMEASKNTSGAVVVAGGGAGQTAPPSEAATGPADLSEVKRLIYSNQRMLRQCYSKLRIDNPDLAGTMWLEMSLGSDNRLRNVRVQDRSTLKSEALRACLERRLFSLQTPAPPGAPHTIVIPLEFAVSE
jgi:hypothetical protein